MTVCLAKEPCPKPKVLPCNATVIEAYLQCGTQWRHGGMGQRTGMDYASVLGVLTSVHPTAPKRVRHLFAGVRVIESALLQVQHERMKRESQADGFPQQHQHPAGPVRGRR